VYLLHHEEIDCASVDEPQGHDVQRPDGQFPPHELAAATPMQINATKIIFVNIFFGQDFN
jgi:hypothetical protein